MPFDKNHQPISPDDLIAAGRCPETGVELEGRDLEGHIASIWPIEPGPEAKRRIELIRAYGRKQKTAAAEKASAEAKAAEEKAAAEK
jgi:hypothetical protein